MNNTISAILNLPEDVDHQTLTELLRPHFPSTRPGFQGQIALEYSQATNEQRLTAIAKAMGITLEQAAKISMDMVSHSGPAPRRVAQKSEPLPEGFKVLTI